MSAFMKRVTETGLTFCCISLLVVLAVGPAFATDDVVPFFAGRTGSPNVMILFDNSNSMQDSPYFRADGNTYKPSTYWRRGVEINPDCDAGTPGNQPCIAEDSHGHILYNQTKYVTNSNELILPSQNPPNLPGLNTADSGVTSLQNRHCAVPNDSLICSNRIYDTHIDWSLVSDWSDFVPYRYWKVRVTDETNNSVQYRTIESRSSGSGYWKVYEDDLQYDPAHTYSYEIVSGVPGEVTHRHKDHFDRVYDRNFDWSVVANWTDFEANYRHKILEVYAGTNSGLRREIYSRDSDYGYWRVADSFPVPCDDTTRYRILGAADDNKYAQGGNHPDSKMYQAKLALQKFLTSGAIKTTDTDANGNTTDRYLMNIGFATFLQAREPITRALYYKKIPAVAEVPGYTIPAHTEHHDAEFEYLYKYHNDHSPGSYLPTGCVNGVPPAVVDPLVNPGNWTQTYHNVSNGATIDRIWNSGCREQTIRYLVTYTCAPTDSLPGRVRVQLASKVNWENNPPAGHSSSELAGVDPDGNPQWGYTNYTWRTFYESDNTHTCETYSPPDPYNGWAYLVQDGESCYEDCRTTPAYDEEVSEVVVPPVPAKEAYYTTTWRDTWGDLRVTNSATPKYIEKNPASNASYIVTPYKGKCNNSWNCTNPDPESGDWTLVTDANEQTNVCLRINSTTGVCNKTGNITSIIFDYSKYRYPGKTDDTDHPHGWSYKNTVRDPDWLTNWRYRKDDGTYLTDDHFVYISGRSYPSNWPDAIQPNPYFPSDSADDFANYKGDDQVVFIDLPEFNDADANKGDDVSGNNIAKVLNYISLARIEYPKDRRYVWTMAPISKDSLTVNETEDETGSGTPLAATLADARKYLTSYMEQDEYSLGGCRKNYIILLTDGTETAGGDPAHEAYLLQHIVVNGEEHPVKVYVIGFGLDAASKASLDAIAESGGSVNHGTEADPKYAYFANNVDELVSILAHDITSDILGGSYGRGKATLTPGSQQGVSSNLALYNAYFDYPVWRGHLEAWGLYPEDVYDANGKLLHRAGSLKMDAGGNKIGEPNWSDGCGGTPPSDPGSPDAGCIMAEANMDPGAPPDGPLTRRTLYTTKSDGSRIEYSPANIGTLKDLVNPPVVDTDSDGIPDAGDDIDGDGIAGTDLDAKAIINYIHHPGFDNAKYVGTRDENWPFADIYNSGPILVTGPRKADCLDSNNDGILDPGSWPSMDGYCAFAENYKTRKDMLYLGTNGGMVEGISAGQHNVPLTGGRENWGYLPSFVLPKLKEFKEGHRFTMDLTVMGSEVDTSDGLDGTGWKTMLVAGQRKGGNNYIALDVTDVDDPQPMWEFSDTNLGQTWSRPEVARIEIAGVKQSVLIFGGGYSPNADVGNRIYIVKASDGTILKEITVGAQANNIPGRITLMPYLVDNLGNLVDYRTNLAKDPAGNDISSVLANRYNFIEVGYFGDTSGDVYRLDGLNSKNGEPWNPHVTRLYHPDANHARPIYYAPVITDIKKGMIDNGIMTGCVKRYVLVGTGDEHFPIATKKADLSPMLDYFMEIEDRGDGASAVDEDNLDWRFNLGMQLPLDQFGFLLQPDGSRAMKDTDGNGTGDKEILSKYIFLANPADGYTVNANGQLVNGDNEIVAMPGNYYFKDTAGNLYSDSALALMIAGAGTYVQVDTSLWLTDVYGWFYDSEDGVKILDTTLYSYDNDGFMLVGTDKITPGGAVCDPLNDACVKVVSDPGEKILSQPVGYGRYMYFTTYTPVGGCATGTSYFYGLKTSSCEPLGGAGTLNYSKVGEGLVPGLRRRIRLGKGISPGPTLGGGTAYVPLYSPGNPPEINAIPVTVGETKLKYWKQN